eukprot:Hpha_TRINITY_DN13795_c0_g2::TRINITY_DN13795_c0_g2_i1::g.142823::m.142823
MTALMPVSCSATQPITPIIHVRTGVGSFAATSSLSEACFGTHMGDSSMKKLRRRQVRGAAKNIPIRQRRGRQERAERGRPTLDPLCFAKLVVGSPNPVAERKGNSRHEEVGVLIAVPVRVAALIFVAEALFERVVNEETAIIPVLPQQKVTREARQEDAEGDPDLE